MPSRKNNNNVEKKTSNKISSEQESSDIFLLICLHCLKKLGVYCLPNRSIFNHTLVASQFLLLFSRKHLSSLFLLLSFLQQMVLSNKIIKNMKKML